jgi:hypothetical protein
MEAGTGNVAKVRGLVGGQERPPRMLLLSPRFGEQPTFPDRTLLSRKRNFPLPPPEQKQRSTHTKYFIKEKKRRDLPQTKGSRLNSHKARREIIF